MVNIFGVLVLFSAAYASRRGETQVPAFDVAEFVNQLQRRPPTTAVLGSTVHPLMLALFQEKRENSVSGSRTIRHSVRNFLSNKEKKALKRSNTVRSLACLGKPCFALLFYISI